MDGGSESLQISPEVACVSGFNLGNCGWAPQNSQLACCVAVNSSRRCILTVRSPNFLPLDRGRSEIRLVPPANDEERHVPLAQRRSSSVLADLPPDFVQTVLDSAEDRDKHAWSLAWMSKEAQLSVEPTLCRHISLESRHTAQLLRRTITSKASSKHANCITTRVRTVYIGCNRALRLGTLGVVHLADILLSSSHETRPRTAMEPPPRRSHRLVGEYIA